MIRAAVIPKEEVSLVNRLGVVSTLSGTFPLTAVCQWAVVTGNGKPYSLCNAEQGVHDVRQLQLCHDA